MLVPDYCVLEATEAEAIRFEDRLADERMRAEARVMVLGTLVTIGGRGGSGILTQSPRVRYRPAPWDDPLPIVISGA